MATRTGRYTIMLDNRPAIAGNAAIAGKKEGEGPLAAEFDKIITDEFAGQKTFEKAESEFVRTAIQAALDKAGVTPDKVDCIFAGDLLNQCVGSSFGIRPFGMPFSGLYGACSTMALSLALAGILTDTNAFGTCVASTSSHFCSAERQYRLPLEYGGQRTQNSQWTATAAGAAVIKGSTGGYPRIDAALIGTIRDLGVTDPNNMGAAMAPAAAQTITQFLGDTGTTPADYDMILTGDLGKTGSALLLELMEKESNTDISAVHNDGGLMLFDLEKQDMHAGGSGCGCSAAVVCSYVINRLKTRELNRVLFVGTGALLSPTTTLQGESIPGIAHAVLLTSE